MIINNGINPNCSETVIRIPKKYKEVAELNNGMDIWTEPVEGYSQMRPTSDTICYYFYQTSGESFRQFLEDNKIPYDVQSPFGPPEEDRDKTWEPLELTEEENGSPSEGGGGECFRRKPYAN